MGGRGLGLGFRRGLFAVGFGRGIGDVQLLSGLHRRGGEEGLRDDFAFCFDFGDFVQASGDAPGLLDLVAESAHSHVVCRSHHFYAVRFDCDEKLVPVIPSLAALLETLPVLRTGCLDLFGTWMRAQDWGWFECQQSACVVVPADNA